MTDDEKFFAWLDGELDPTEAAEVEAKVAADPELQRLADQHRALGTRLRRAFDPIAAEPVPERLRAALHPPAEVVDLAAAREKRAARNRRHVVQWGAMAATLAVGILVGTAIPRGSAAPVEVRGSKLYAAASLNHALDTQLASAPAGEIRIGLTFRDQAGQVCRTFTQPAASGLACRDDGHWRLRGLFAAPEGQATTYRMASGMDPNLAALIDSTMAGEPFDAAQEKAAKTNGWK
jgi:hypothetical protein